MKVERAIFAVIECYYKHDGIQVPSIDTTISHWWFENVNDANKFASDMQSVNDDREFCVVVLIRGK